MSESQSGGRLSSKKSARFGYDSTRLELFEEDGE